MTMARIPRIYWDACTWIAYINQEKSIRMQDGQLENRFAMCSTILNQAIHKKLEIVTSAFTLAEVCKKPEIRDSRLESLSAFFDKSYILIVPVDMAIGRQAQIMQSSGLVNLKPADAIHLASSQRASVVEMHTFDEKILTLDGKIADANANPMKICRPTYGQLLGPLFGDKEDESGEDTT